MQGSIFIPDITGFTNFVNSVKPDLGVYVIRKLLNEIIINNPLDIQLSEIEGDAILYFKPGKPIGIEQILQGLQKMSKAFDRKYRHLKNKHCLGSEMSLKFVVHYGNITVYKIAGFISLYGEAVIESHRLLKNGAGLTNYVLITEDYFKALNVSATELPLQKLNYNYCSSKTFEGLRTLSYYFFDCVPQKTAQKSWARA